MDVATDIVYNRLIMSLDRDYLDHNVGVIRAALAEARREERERCRETCEMAERKLSEALAHESAKAHEAEVERLREAVLKAPCPRYDELHKQGLCLDCRRYIQPCWKIRALDGEGD